MEGFTTKTNEKHNHAGAADFSAPDPELLKAINSTQGSSVLDSDFKAALAESVQSPAPVVNTGDDHDHSSPGSNPEFHISLDAVDVKSINLGNAKGRGSIGKLVKLAVSGGDYLDPGSGKNTVIGSGGNDIVVGKGRGFNTITTGTGKDTVVLGAETTNRIFDFDPNTDTIAIDASVPMENIVIAQGKNPGKGGIKQPLDSTNNTLIIDKESGHILGALTFVKAESLSDRNFVQVRSEVLDRVSQLGKFSNTQQDGDGGQQLNGTVDRDKLIGGGGDDFLYVGDDGFKLGTAKGSGPAEFPFPNTSAGTSEMQLELKGGVLKATGTYKDFEGVPLFSNGVQEVAPDAVIPNGADPKALIEGFLKVPQDSEGNAISGFHLHFSREKFADATVQRYFTVTPTDAKSGQVSGEFELAPEEQAALLANNFYGNLHSTKHPVGENRLEFNTTQFTQQSKDFSRSQRARV